MITAEVCSLWFALSYLVLSKSIFSHVVLPLDLYLHLLRDVRDHHVNQTTNEENYMLRGEDCECLYKVTTATQTTALGGFLCDEWETLTSKTMTKLSCMAMRWKNSGRYSPFSSLKPRYLPRTTTTLCCNVTGWERPTTSPMCQTAREVITPTCRLCVVVAACSCSDFSYLQEVFWCCWI